jgi:predicted MPP superfamily phosphohydrolase
MSKRYIWLTDIHLNFLSDKKCVEFLSTIGQQKSDGVFITGDIANGKCLVQYLTLCSKYIQCPIYFTLGNHDFYKSTFKEVEELIKNLKQNNLYHLNTYEPISLSSNTALIGHDGWVDSGKYEPKIPLVFAGDWYFINDFRQAKSNEARRLITKERAHNAATIIAKNLKLALSDHSIVYLLTHWPPWLMKYPGIVNKFWRPYYCSKIIADNICNVMSNFPDKKLIVLAGHTHIAVNAKITNNIELRVGASKLKKPFINDIITID